MFQRDIVIIIFITIRDKSVEKIKNKILLPSCAVFRKINSHTQVYIKVRDTIFWLKSIPKSLLSAFPGGEKKTRKKVASIKYIRPTVALSQWVVLSPSLFARVSISLSISLAAMQICFEQTEIPLRYIRIPHDIFFRFSTRYLFTANFSSEMNIARG